MNLSGSLITIFEIAMVAFVIWAVFNEDKFVAFEEHVATHFRRRKFKVINGNNVCKTCYPERYRA